jgi:hypothetical protein
MRFIFRLSLILVLPLALATAAKQKIIVKLREPLKAETIKVRMTEITNNRGETRDLETKIDLSVKEKVEAPKTQTETLKLNMTLRNIGTNAVQVILALPEPGFIEVVVMDFYGKSLNTLYSGNMAKGIYPLGPFPLKDGENNGIKFMTLRIDGKMVLKKVMTKVN